VFTIPDAFRIKEVLYPDEKLTDMELFQNPASELLIISKSTGFYHLKQDNSN
jgi:hypothetical protein